MEHALANRTVTCFSRKIYTKKKERMNSYYVTAKCIKK